MYVFRLEMYISSLEIQIIPQEMPLFHGLAEPFLSQPAVKTGEQMPVCCPSVGWGIIAA